MQLGDGTEATAAIPARCDLGGQSGEKKTVQTRTNELDMWSFYEPGDWPVAKTNAHFIWFLLSRSTRGIEIVGLDHNHITFAVYGPPGEEGIPGVVQKTLERQNTQMSDRKLIVAAIRESYPGCTCEKRQMAKTVAAFFDVPWEVERDRSKGKEVNTK